MSREEIVSAGCAEVHAGSQVQEEGAEPVAGDGQTEPGLGGSRHQLLGLQEEQGRPLGLRGQ